MRGEGAAFKRWIAGMANDRAKQLRRGQTESERLVWQHLRRRQLGGCKFRRQQPFGPYIADLVCFEKRLVVEVDGGQHGNNAAYDLARTDWLKIQGFRVLRFWNTEVLQQIEGVKQAILLALEGDSSPLPLTPSHKGRENVVPSPISGEG